ncbi:MAG: O-antigen ligase family protein, partial [Actinobacteria bacterium]|nr:O-antigen ligase family protein [Actinomycetota bacterium]
VQTGLGVRWIFWRAGLSSLKHRILVGYGPADYSFAYRTGVTRDQLKTVGDPDREVQDAHNLFVEVAVTTGIPGLIVMLVLVASIVLAMRPFTGVDPDVSAMRSGAAILFAVHMFEPLSLVLTPLMFILAAAAIGSPVPAIGSEENAEEGPVLPSTKNRSRIAKKAFGGAAITLGASLAVSLIASGFLLARGSLYWDRGDLASSANLDPTCSHCLSELAKVRQWDFSRGRVGTEAWALGPYEQVVRMHPNDADAYLRLGGGLMFLGHPGQAAEEFAKARQLAPNSPLAAGALASAYVRDGKFPLALSPAKDAVANEPTPGNWALLEAVAIKLGLTDLATQAHERAKGIRSNLLGP